jgi:hypothetical protein
LLFIYYTLFLRKINKGSLPIELKVVRFFKHKRAFVAKEHFSFLEGQGSSNLTSYAHPAIYYKIDKDFSFMAMFTSKAETYIPGVPGEDKPFKLVNEKSPGPFFKYCNKLIFYNVTYLNKYFDVSSR